MIAWPDCDFTDSGACAAYTGYASPACICAQPAYQLIRQRERERADDNGDDAPFE